MSGLMSISGMVSGLKTDEILSQMEQIARVPIQRMNVKKSQAAAQRDAWAAANTRVLAIKEKANALSSLLQNMPLSASSSESSVTVATSSGAVAGTHTFTVNSLATYHQLTSQAYADQDVTSVGTGTFTITVGDEATAIDVQNLTLTGLRDAINTADIGVDAMIISTGGATPQYRLLLKSDTLGSDGKITVQSTLAGGTAPAMVDLQAATDARITFGTGDNAFSVTRSSNTLSDVIPGVTLTLKPDSVDETVTVTVSNDTSKVKKAIQDLVDQYNQLIDFVAQQNQFDEKTGETGTLFGEYRLSQVKNDLISNLFNPIEGLPDTLNSMSQLGVGIGDSGKIEQDSNKLQEILDKNYLGALKVLSEYGTPSNSAVSYISSSKDTKPSGSAGFAIHVSQPATQARLIIDSAGDGLPETLAQGETLLINGISITLTAGMTHDEVKSAINAKADETGVSASLTDATGSGTGAFLTLTRRSFGSSLHIDVISDVDAAAGGTGIGTSILSETAAGTGNTGITGQDIQGTINGGETITGIGQMLTANTGDASDLKLQITATAAGDYGTVVFTRGTGGVVKSLLDFVTDPSNGTFKGIQDGLQKEIDALDKDINDTEKSVSADIARMRSQFNAMESALSKLQNQSAQLNGLIAQLG